MRSLLSLFVVILAAVASATLLDVYSGSSCPTGSAVFQIDITASRCYTVPSSGTCNMNAGCAQVLTATDRDLANLIRVANCTRMGNSFILGGGNIRYFGTANCTGIESSGPLNNPCLSLSLCNATDFGTGPFKSQSSAASSLESLLGAF